MTNKSKFFAELKKQHNIKKFKVSSKNTKLDKIQLNSMSDLQSSVSELEGLSDTIATSDLNLTDGYKEYFDTLDRIIMDTSFIYGMNEKLENELNEAVAIMDSTTANLENLERQFDELGIEPPANFLDLRQSFDNNSAVINGAYSNFEGNQTIRDEAEAVNSATVNKKLGF